MVDLEDRLRDELLHTARSFEPSADLPERVGARIERRAQRNRLLLAAAAVVVVVALAGGLVTLGPGPGSDPERVGTAGEGEETSSTTRSERPSTTTSSSLPATTTTPQAPPSSGPEETTSTSSAPTPAVDGDSLLSRWGVGPIRAGMTIPEAEAAAGVRLVTDPGAWEGFGRRCSVFTIEGAPHGLSDRYLLFVAQTPGLVPSDDPRVAVIDAVGVANATGAVTPEGIGEGSTVEEVNATYGEPTATAPDALADDPTAQVLIHEDGGYSYGFRVIRGVVREVRSGHVRDLGAFEPCQ